MKCRAIISTHHKTGTVWMGGTFRGIGRALDIPCLSFNRKKTEVAAACAPVIFLDNHGNWYAKGQSHREEDRVFHLVRDPRDVVISAMHYHRTSREAWLHVQHDEFDGMTYQQKINSLPDDRARYRFEMGNSAGRVTRAMSVWDYERPECFECKYEDLVGDVEMSLFTKIATHLGFEGDELEACRKQFWRHSLFGGKVKKKKKTKKHVRSGSARQWQSVFDQELGALFLKKFGDVLVRLGYERDDSWVDALGQDNSQKEILGAA